MNQLNWKLHSVDGGLLAFNRLQGMNVLVSNEETIAEKRLAPRSLQVGLLTPCNLHCDFCYRDTAAPSRLTAEFLIDLLTKASNWGVLEVSFGGGEPLLFKDFVPLVRRLHEHTSLGINFTTNGTLLTPDVLHELGSAVGEIRVSAYPDNNYRRTLRMLASYRSGLNLLVTPANLGMLEVIAKDALLQGAENILLLGYKGFDPKLHLSRSDLEQLRQAIVRMQQLPLRLDICWYPLLSDLPHLFPRSDCGAGDEFLVITPDRSVQACSFHEQRIPFETFEDLTRIYAELRACRPAAAIAGCTRKEFATLNAVAPPTRQSLWMWQARSSNNSGDWTIVGRFRSTELAQQAAEALRRLSRAHEAFLASPEGNAWIEEKQYNGSWPTPPLQQFGEAHGFDWTDEGEGLWWEEDGAGAPVLSAGAVGDAVVVYHPYCMGLPQESFRKFFAAVGATEFGYWQYDRPSVIATGRGAHPRALAAIDRYMALVGSVEYPSELTEPPPWGSECIDSRVLDDEDRSAILSIGPCAVQSTDETIRIVLTFENTFAGAIALEKWLADQGYTNILLQVGYLLEPLAESNSSPRLPNTDLFPEIEPIKSRLAALSDAELIETLFAYHSDVPAALEEAIQRIPIAIRLPLAHRKWQERRKPGVDVDWRALLVIEKAGQEAAKWMREIWPLLLAENFPAIAVALRAMAATLPAEEAFALALGWLGTAKDRAQYADRLKLCHFLGNSRTVTLIENWWNDSRAEEPITPDWSHLASASKIDWPTLRRWLESGRPLGLIAIGTLELYLSNSLPEAYSKPARNEFIEVLTAYKARDSAPRATRSVNRLIASAHFLSNE